MTPQDGKKGGETMTQTTNEHQQGPLGVGYDADDHNGHTGHGDTAEQAQQALEAAQAAHTANGVYESLFGVVFTGGGSDKK